jgi:hypothetical protein
VILLSGMHSPTMPEPFHWNVSVSERPRRVDAAGPTHSVRHPERPTKTASQGSDTHGPLVTQALANEASPAQPNLHAPVNFAPCAVNATE